CEITQDCLFGLCVDAVCTDENDLLPNGAICTQDSECRTGNCGTSVGGERFCYGFVPNGEVCDVTQDCAAGVCRGGTCTDPGSCNSDAECNVGAICDADKHCKQVCGSNAFATDGACSCLPGFEWASADPSDTNCVRPTVLAGCHIL